MYNTDEVIERVYRLFVPSATERLKMDRIAGDFIDSLRKRASEHGLSVDFRFSGSYAKGTWMRGESDIDILAVFDRESDMKNLDSLVPNNFIETFGTRKYFRGYIKDTEIEVIPVLKFSEREKVKNSIDLSVLHADYINSKLSQDQKKDVIVLKALCKANKCYGSETYMHGFSGYALEVLIGEFGDIKNLIKQAEGWKEGVIVGNSPGKMSYPIFLSDPTNPVRNICASVSVDSLSKFIFALKLFKMQPSMRLFSRVNLNILVREQKKKRGTLLFTFSTKIIEPRDVFLSKYVKNANKLMDELKRNDVEVYSVDFDYSRREAKMFLQVSNFPRTKARLVYGPSVFSSLEVIEEFMKSHKNPFVVQDRLCYDKKYDVTDFNKFILLKIKEYMSNDSIANN